MMISPEFFYEMHIKNKSLDEILIEIKATREKINDLEITIQNTPKNPDFFISPSPETKLSCYKKYLEYSLTQLIKKEILDLKKGVKFSFLPFFNKYDVMENEKFEVFANISKENLFKSADNHEEKDIGLPYNFKYLRV